MPELKINIDYHLDEIGRMVFTEAYHLKRGYCCKNRCLNCPWKETDKSKLKKKKKKD
jgi:Family of unknown function (DUF5522)